MWRFTVPSVAVSSPTISFNSVLFPAPLGPTSAILESQSMPNSKFSYRWSSFLPVQPPTR